MIDDEEKEFVLRADQGDFNLNTKLELITKGGVDSFLFEKFLADHPKIIYFDQQVIPEAINVVLDEKFGSRIVATKSHKINDVIYRLTTYMLNEDNVILYRIKNIFMVLNNLEHTVRRENGKREFYYFDTFMNHSCDPNTISYYTSKTTYETRVLKSIVPGDELTCDYGVFDTDPDGNGFACTCQSPQCRGWIGPS